ncbi:hypothetical protein GCM10018782_04750 [Streptomyces griseoaurantiacus]|nr:hypothetical protein GCM10018782_04750 [Streptomyces griseoaurantiacus]
MRAKSRVVPVRLFALSGTPAPMNGGRNPASGNDPAPVASRNSFEERARGLRDWGGE